MLTQCVIHTQRRVRSRRAVGRGLGEEVGEAPIIDRCILPGGLGEEAGEVGLVGAVEHAAGDIAQAFVGQDDQARKILLEVVKLAPILKQILEGDRVRRYEWRGGNNWQLHQRLPFPTPVC